MQDFITWFGNVGISGLFVPLVLTILVLIWKFFEKELEIVLVGFIGISFVLSGLIFFPESIVNSLGLLEYREKTKIYLGISLLFCFIAIITFLFIYMAGVFYLKKRQKRLHCLTKHEKEILKRYIFNETRTDYFECNDGVIKGLEIESIIFRSSTISSTRYGHGVFTFSYNIQPWAWDYLNKNTDLLE
jgi:hypothetical protein